MILAILQARVSSSRLPGKVLLPILRKPMLARQIERVRKAKKIDQLIVATSVESEDDPIARVAEDMEIPCFRGSLNDVLDRFYQATKRYNPEHIVRLTGDCPLTDPEVIDRLIQFHIDGEFDYSSNALEPSYPDGLDVEAMTLAALKEAWLEARLPIAREHVTWYLYQHADQFKIGVEKSVENFAYFRWTVDEQADFKFVEKVYGYLYEKNPDFKMKDVVALIQREPSLRLLNQHIDRNEGLKKS